MGWLKQVLSGQLKRREDMRQCLTGSGKYRPGGTFDQERAKSLESEWSNLSGLDFERTLRFAEKGVAGAQYELGATYYGKGYVGAPKDDKESIRWYRLAAEQGFALALSQLGYAYYEGKGVPQDYVQAYAWFGVAAKSVQHAAEAQSECLEKMTPSQIKEGNILCQEHKKRWPRLK